VSPLHLTYLNALDVAALALADDEILAAVEQGLAAQGRGHFNVLRGAFRAD
jgi:alanine dehydrogenase